MLGQATYIAYRSQILGDFWIVKKMYGFLHFAIYKKASTRLLKRLLCMFLKKISSSRNAYWIYLHVQWCLIIHFYLYRMDVIVRIPRLYKPGKLHLQIHLFLLLLRKNELKTCNLKINHGIRLLCILDGCLFSFYFFRTIPCRHFICINETFGI